MNTFDAKDQVSEPSLEQQQQAFAGLNLKEIGLNAEDFTAVMNAQKELNHMSQNSVAEYGKNIAAKTSVYTDELLALVKNKDLEGTGQKLSEVVQVAQQLNGSNLLNPNRSTGFLSSLFNKVRGSKQSSQWTCH